MSYYDLEYLSKEAKNRISLWQIMLEKSLYYLSLNGYISYED
jgi:hypothetical protein